jgi:hypothetical protein
MKTAKVLAVDAVHEAMGGGWSRVTFEAMLADPGDAGATLRRLVASFERAIEADRKTNASLRAPS